MTDVSTGSARQLRDEPLTPEVLQSDLAFHGRVWDVVSDRVAYGEGEMVRQYVKHTGAVAIVALDDQDRVLLIQQYRHPIRHRDWELPAGLLDIEGEEPLLAAQRELAEEADLVAAHWEPLISSWTTPGGNDELIRIFLATGVEQASAVHDREDEEADIRLEWVPLADAIDAVLEGRMRNGILAIGLLAAARRRPKV
ncbi:ADP-ribose pyrophosphatase [Microbacterium hydrocarbonoxydans]|uniref:ADP-ribose pyrophosphatase n=1 Tax=Microbacterium hydrocarbonoxydans TaxID=273678 RepID=A0A0M2HN81_9MICO|nr:NUDIX hydrolase [Microbacterium hydrocarbonoxydans]KJL45922.1 ADP-ribose pyrophosphatase [Microbacterium hydrocarbonoxydans]